VDNWGSVHSLNPELRVNSVCWVAGLSPRPPWDCVLLCRCCKASGRQECLTIKPQAESALRLGLRREQDKVNKLKSYDTKCMYWFWVCRGTVMNCTNSTVRYKNVLPLRESIVNRSVYAQQARIEKFVKCCT